MKYFPFMHATAASMHTQTRECAFSLIILFTYCILPINGHKQENKSIKLTCCVLLASKFVDITEISLALFMEADGGWYNTEKMELSSRTSIRLCFVTWSMLIPNLPSLSLPILPQYSHMRPIFEHNPNHFFHLISEMFFFLIPTLKVHNAAFLWNISSGWLRRFNDDMLILQYSSIFFYLARLSVTTPHAKFGITINCPCGKHSIERVEHMWCAYQKCASF